MGEDSTEKDQGIAFPKTGHESRYLGYGVSEERLPSLLHDLSRKIDVAWEEVLGETGSSNLFDHEVYKQVASKMPELSIRVQELALQFSKSEDPVKKEEGMKILFHTNLKTILVVVDRFSELGPFREELLERGILAATGVLENFKPGREPLSMIIHNAVTYNLQEVSADYFDVPVNWIIEDYIQKIPKWIGEFHHQHGRLPEAKEITQQFRVNVREIEYQLREGFLSMISRQPQILVEEEEALRPAELAIIHETIETTLEGLPARRAKILRMHFGLKPYDKAYTLEEVGRELGVTRERIRKIENQALRELRHPRLGRPLRGLV